MNKLKVINLFGGPGIGKSVLAAGIYHELGKRDYRVEMARETVKDWCYEDRKMLFDCSLSVFAREYEKLWRIARSGQVDIVVTDHPLLLSVIYNEGEPAIFSSYVKSKIEEFANYNYRLIRDPHDNYNPDGRIHDFKEAVFIDEKIKFILLGKDTKYPWTFVHSEFVAAVYKNHVDAVVEQILYDTQK
jgi:hypothetical protein